MSARREDLAWAAGFFDGERANYWYREQQPRWCAGRKHDLKQVDRVNKGCGPCYRDKYPNTVKYTAEKVVF